MGASGTVRAVRWPKQARQGQAAEVLSTALSSLALPAGVLGHALTNEVLSTALVPERVHQHPSSL